MPPPPPPLPQHILNDSLAENEEHHYPSIKEANDNAKHHTDPSHTFEHPEFTHGNNHQS
jgi:hypothetical protein